VIGRSTVRDALGTGRRRCRGPGRGVGGDGDRSADWSVSPVVQATLADRSAAAVASDVAMSGTGSEIGRSTRAATLADWSAAMSGTGRRTGRRRHGDDVGGTGRRTGQVHPWVASALADRLPWAMSGGQVTGRWRCRGLVGATPSGPVEDGRSTRGCTWSAAMSGMVASGGTGRRRRRGLVGGLVEPPVAATLATGRRRCRGPVRTGRWRCRGLVGGDVGGTGGRSVHPWWRRWRRTNGGDVGGPVGDWSVAMSGDCGGDVGDRSDGSHHPWVATLADRSAAMSGTVGGPVGGDVGAAATSGRCRGDWSVARRRGLVGGLVGPPVGATGRRRCRRPVVGGDGDWSAATSGTGRRTGRSTAWRRWRTGRRRCRGPGGLVGMMSGTGRRRIGGLGKGLVGPPVGGDVGGLVGGDGGTGRRLSVAMSGDWSATSGTGRLVIHPWVKHVGGPRRDAGDGYNVMSGTVGVNVGRYRRTGRSTRGKATLADRLGGDRVGGPVGDDVGTNAATSGDWSEDHRSTRGDTLADRRRCRDR
jgi:hypothetical protein